MGQSPVLQWLSADKDNGHLSLKTGKYRASAPKLQTLPPTTEAFHQNVLRAHIQTAHLFAALDIDPPDLDPKQFDYEADHINKRLIPRPLAQNVEVAPENLMKLVRCGCCSGQSCKTGNCGCKRHQMACTLFCECGGRMGCNNPFQKPTSTHEEESDEDDDYTY